MTTKQLGETYARLGASLIDLGSRVPGKVSNPPIVGEQQALGAASLLCLIRDLFTGTPKESFSRGELLVLLETLSHDEQLFPHGIGTAMWAVEDEEVEPA